MKLLSRNNLFLLIASVMIAFILFNNNLQESHNSYQSSASKNYETNIKFIDATKDVGIDYVHQLHFPGAKSDVYNRGLALKAVSPSVAVIDFDKDGYIDFAMSTGDPEKPILLYKNIEGTHFQEVSAQWGLSGAGKQIYASAIAWVDYNNDSFPDLFVGAWGCNFLFKNEGKRFLDAELNDEKCSGTNSINFFDFENDGDVDILVGDYVESQRLTIPNLARKHGDKENGGTNLLLVNDGLRFHGITPFKGKSYTMAVGLAYINDDPFADILFTNDYSTDELYISDSSTSHIDQTDQYMPVEHHGYAGMNAEFGDINDDGLLDLYISNIYKKPYYRKGNNLWIRDKSNKFVESSNEMGVQRCGHSWAAKFADFNNDGKNEIFVVNGYFRGPKSKPDNNSYWWSFINQVSTPPYVKIPYFKHISQRNLETYEYSGFENFCLFQKREGKFVDVAISAGLTDDFPSRGASLIDFDNNGKLDLIVANYGYPLKFYKNVSQGSNLWVGLHLVRKDNLPTVGSKITLHLKDGSTLNRELFPSNGFKGQSDERLAFGLGKGAIDKAVVRWPNGKIDHYTNLVLNRYNTLYAKD